MEGNAGVFTGYRECKHTRSAERVWCPVGGVRNKKKRYLHGCATGNGPSHPIDSRRTGSWET